MIASEMESGQALWLNRRVQRSGLIGFFVLTLITIILYSRQGWPDGTDMTGQFTGGSDFAPSNGRDVPIVDSKASMFDLMNMPKIPSFYKQGAGEKDSKLSNVNVSPGLDPTRVAMIIETRSLSHLPALLASYIAILPPQWVIRMIGTPNAFENIRSSAPLIRAVKTGRLVLTNLPDEYPVNGQEEISATLTNITFYRDFLAPAEWLLIFQADSVLCASSDQTMDDWVEKGYPWVGAPWNADVPGGNGGLSLRYVPRIVSILEKESRRAGDEFWEDRWLCDRINDTALPPVAKYFAVESMWYDKPLGYHLRGSGIKLDMTVWGNATMRRHIFSYCPETKMILGNVRLPDPNDEKLWEEENRPGNKAIDSVANSAAAAVKEIMKDIPPDRHVPPIGDTKLPEKGTPKQQEPAKLVAKPVTDEDKRKEADKKEADKKEADKKEADKKEADKKEAAKKEPATKVPNKKEATEKELETKKPDAKKPDTKEFDPKVFDAKVPDKKEATEKELDTKKPEAKEFDPKAFDAMVPDTKGFNPKVFDAKVPDTKAPKNDKTDELEANKKPAGKAEPKS